MIGVLPMKVWRLGLAAGIELEKELHKSSLRDAEMMDGLRRFADGVRPKPPESPA